MNVIIFVSSPEILILNNKLNPSIFPFRTTTIWTPAVNTCPRSVQVTCIVRTEILAFLTTPPSPGFIIT